MAQTRHDIIMPTEARHELPEVRTIEIADLRDALRLGVDDFMAMPTHAIFLALIYPVAGFLMAGAVFNYELLPFLYPLASGFALIGPFAAIGLYELSRRREAGLDTSWRHAFDVIHSPSIRSLLAIGALLLAIFVVWLMVAQALFASQFGVYETATIGQFASDIMNTAAGHRLFVYGNLVGLLFAIVAFSLSVISFPLLLDRNVGYGAAITTSLMVIARNPLVMTAWGLIVASALVVGSLPLLVGLAVVVPILGHATWHLYRKVIAPDPRARPTFRSPPKGKRYAADFPASLFTRSTREGDGDMRP